MCVCVCFRYSIFCDLALLVCDGKCPVVTSPCAREVLHCSLCRNGVVAMSGSVHCQWPSCPH